jgi:diguanylate cyclase (GGDEF)-like protein/PAS domain S-box-containing protein
MRRLPLRVALPLGMALLLLLVIGGSLINALDKKLAQLDQQARRDLRAYSTHLAHMTSEGWESSRALVESDLAQMATDPRTETAMLLDETGRVLAASRYAWHGRFVKDVLPEFDLQRFEAAKAGRLPLVYGLTPERTRIAVMQPFNVTDDPLRVRSLHKGIVYMSFDLVRERQLMRQFVFKARAPDIAATLLLLLLLAWLLQRHVAVPLGRLASAAAAMRAGRRDVSVPETGAGEIVALAENFNAMVRAVQEAQAELATSEERLAITLNSIGDAILATDDGGRVVLMNPIAEELTGWSRQEALGRMASEVLTIEASSGASIEQVLGRVLGDRCVTALSGDIVLHARDGTLRHIADSAAPILNAHGDVQGAVLVFRDVSVEYQLREKLANSELHFRALADGGQVLIWTSGPDMSCDYFNEPWLRFTGRTLEQERGVGWTEGVHPEDLARCMRIYREAFARREPFSMEYRLRHASGDYRWIIDQGGPRYDARGRFLGFIGHCMDVTDAKRAEAEIERLAYHDALTGLPNRTLFLDRLEQALAASRRNHRCGAVLFIDLDHFKQINDVHGHAMGDAVLREIARRLQFHLRQEDTVARLGGDEFVVLLPELAGSLDDAGAMALSVAEKLRGAIGNPVVVGEQAFVTGASIGITLFPRVTEGVDDLMREADTAMYRAKERGRNALVYFEPAMQEAVSERYALDQALREAVRTRSFELYLQSQFDATGRAVGAEALVRWRHPGRGLIMPASFIPLAEENGLIVQIGEWVLRETCALIARLDREGRGLRIAVNVSPRQFHQDDFVQRVREILAATGADPTYLTLEITENLLIGHTPASVARMTELAALGLRFAIDDFGTGYSSLMYLKRLPLAELKIDKSFVQDVPHDVNDVALVETILSVARHLHFEVVAEGVENEAQLAFLHAQGCERFQGYHFQRPQPAAAWIDRLPAARLT